MMKKKCLLVLLAVIFLIFLNSEIPKKKENRLLNVEEILNYIKQFEELLNKDNATLKDVMATIVPSEQFVNYELEYEDLYCKEVLKVKGLESKECLEFDDQRWKNLDTSPSLWLKAVKNALTGGKKKKIKLFVEAGIKPCPKETLGKGKKQTINAIAQVDGTYKQMQIKVACDLEEGELFGFIGNVLVENKFP